MPDHRPPRRRTPPPVLARIAGLPTEVLERLSTALCDELPECDRVAAELARARAELEERLFAAVPGVPTELRRMLLAVKRDCHNARPLAAHVASPAWAGVCAAAAGAADRVAALEAEAAALDADFEQRFAQERDRQRRLLRGLARDRAFARGLALATPDLARALRGHAGDASEAAGRRDERADTALLRYASRAAIKVSPFSTFTPVGLGSLRRDAGTAGVELRGPWRARSLVRLKRFLLDQSVFLLLHYPPFADGLRIAPNDSACETEPGRFVFLRPGRWAVDGERGELRYHPEALVRMAPQGPVDARLREILAVERPPRAALLATLEAELAGRVDAAAVRERVEYLLEVGFIEPVLPWPGQEPHLERRVLAHLRTLPPDPALEAYLAELEAIVALQDGYAGATDPGAALAELERRIQALREAAARLGGVDPAVAARGGPAEYHVYEDVFLEGGRGPSRDVLRLSRAAAVEAMESVRPLVRLSALYDRSHDFLETLDAFARERWPGAATVGATELFHAAQPLWREYARFYAHWWKEKDTTATWNPLELPELRALARHRAEVQAALPGCLEWRDGENHVRPEAIEALLEPLPERWTDASAWGACLLLQPASADGSRWMLSRVKEGTGRYGSRYTAAMDPGARRRYTAHLAKRGAFALGGERVELLDVPRAQGDTLNVHATQTPRVLTLPGDAPAVPPARRVSLGALRVRFGEGRPTLRGPGGERFLPVHLGMAFECYMPQAVRFLCAFGPNELGGVFPRQAMRREGEVTVAERTILGNLVLHRRGWVVPTASLAQAARGADARAFAAVDRLRRAWGIPGQVFFSERLSNFFFGTVHKPQYLDFTSPLFLPLLRDALEGAGESLHLAEMLPDFGMCPRDGAGRRWAVEVMVDSLALRTPLARGRSATAGVRAGHPAAVAGG